MPYKAVLESYLGVSSIEVTYELPSIYKSCILKVAGFCVFFTFI